MTDIEASQGSPLPQAGEVETVQRLTAGNDAPRRADIVVQQVQGESPID